jgi:hypothetical protein
MQRRRGLLNKRDYERNAERQRFELADQLV